MNKAEFWWERPDLKYENTGLVLSGISCHEIVSKNSTPLFVYSKNRILENINRLKTALDTVNLTNQLLYAMKANRHPALLNLIAKNTDCGIDACSPREVELAISCGFTPDRDRKSVV